MNTVRVEFKNDLGEQYVDMRAFKSIPWSLSKKISAIGGASSDGEGKVVMNESAAFAFAEAVTLELVIGGHVLDAYTGEPMSFPLTSESIQNAPVEMLMAVSQAFGEQKAKADPKN